MFFERFLRHGLGLLAFVALVFLTAGCANIPPTTPATAAAVPVPQLLSAEYVGVPTWDPIRRVFVNEMRVRFTPTTGRLFLHESNNWRNRNGTGVAVREVDVSQWARQGLVVRERRWSLQGEYTLTMTLRTPGGVSNSITLPTLIVQ